MANYEHLPVFKSSYDLLLELYKTTKLFDKEYKYTIGEQIKKSILKLVLTIHKINSVDKSIRVGFLDEAINYGEEIKLLLRICADLQLFNLKKFAKLSEMEVGILKQLEGWKKQYGN